MDGQEKRMERLFIYNNYYCNLQNKEYTRNDDISQQSIQQNESRFYNEQIKQRNNLKNKKFYKLQQFDFQDKQLSDMEKKINYSENTPQILSINQINQQQPCIPAFDVINSQYNQGQNNQNSFDIYKIQTNTIPYSQIDSYPASKAFNSPQISSYAKCQNYQMNFNYSPKKNTTQILPSQNLVQQVENQQFPAMNLQLTHSTSSTEAHTPFASSFDYNDLFQSTQDTSSNNKSNNFRRNLQSHIQQNNYFQQAPFINPQTTKNVASNQRIQQNQQFSNFVNHYASPKQQLKSRFRKHPFTPSSNSYNESTDFQFRARSGSFQLLTNNHFNIPSKKKQIDEKCSKKQKRPNKHYTKQYFNQQTKIQNQYNDLPPLFNNLTLEEINEYDNHRITNEDLITTHQEYMKEEQNDSNKDDEYNISENEDEVDNLDEITLESTHKHNHGCSMIDSIIDDWNNEDDQKVDQIASQQVINIELSKAEQDNNINQDQINSKNKFNLNQEANNDIQYNETFQNSQNNNSCIFNEEIISNNFKQTDSQSKNNINYDKYSEQQEEISKSNDDSFDKSQQFHSKSIKMIDDSQNSLDINVYQEDILKSEKTLNKMLKEATKEIENPQALFEIVQRLATQVREKDQTIRTMRIQSSQNSIKSFNQLPLKYDFTESQEINSRLKQLTLNEKQQKEQYQQNIQKL